MIVEGLVPDKRRPGSTRVVVDGKPVWTVPADVVRSLALSPGTLLGAEAVSRLDAAAEEEGALRAGMRLLARRAHGREEIRRKLARKGHDPVAVTAALIRLDRLDLTDDAGFAAEYAASRAGRGSSPERIQRDLVRLGVPAELAVNTVADTVAREGLDPWQRTMQQGTRRAASMRALPKLTQQRRLLAFFARRGFRGGEAHRAVRELVGTSAVEEFE